MLGEANRVLENAKKLIEEVVAPLVQADGGQIEFVGMVDKRLLVRLHGTCSGCPGRPYTIGRIIEPVAKKWLGEDVRVEAVSD